jgi:hypothetical protein
MIEKFDHRIERGVNVFLEMPRQAPPGGGVIAKNGRTAAGKEQRFGEELEIGGDGLAGREIKKIMHGDASEGVAVFLERLKAHAGIDGIGEVSGEAGFGASEFFEGLIVDEETQSALGGIPLGRVDAEVHGGGFAGAIGGFERMEVELDIVGVRKDEAGTGFEVAPSGVLIGLERVGGNREDSRETIVGGKGDVGAAMG